MHTLLHTPSYCLRQNLFDLEDVSGFEDDDEFSEPPAPGSEVLSPLPSLRGEREGEGSGDLANGSFEEEVNFGAELFRAAIDMVEELNLLSTGRERGIHQGGHMGSGEQESSNPRSDEALGGGGTGEGEEVYEYETM